MLALNIQNIAMKNQKPKSTSDNWLDSLISKGKIGANHITDIKSSFYKGKIVYLVNFNVACCDQFSAVLIDENGNTICYPFGGFSGKGDMKCTDYLKEKTDEKTVWINENIEEKTEKKAKSFKMTKL